MTYVRSILDSNAVLWCPQEPALIRKIEGVQRVFTKRIPGMKNMSYMARLKELGLETLELRRLKTDLCEVFKIRHGLSGLDFDDYFSDIEFKIDKKLIKIVKES